MSLEDSFGEILEAQSQTAVVALACLKRILSVSLLSHSAVACVMDDQQAEIVDAAVPVSVLLPTCEAEG